MFQPIFYIQLYEMKHEDYIDKINSLTTAVNQFKESYSLLKFSLEASEKRNESLQFQVTRLQDIICIFTDEISGLRVEEFNLFYKPRGVKILTYVFGIFELRPHIRPTKK